MTIPRIHTQVLLSVGIGLTEGQPAEQIVLTLLRDLTLILQHTKIRIMVDDTWMLEYDVEDDGTIPVREFLNQMDQKTYARFQWSLEQLQARNVQARYPFVRHLEGKLWELREESRTNIYRIIYAFFTGRRIVLLHGFEKKTEKTPQREIETAQKRLERFVRREGGSL